MATYNTPLITTQGLSLLKAEIAGNDSVTFTKIVFSSDDYSQTSDSSVQALTALSSLDLTATARSFTDVNGNLKIRGVANNQNTTSAFYIKTYGLYGKNKAGSEMLIAVSTSQNANFVPAYNNKQTNQIAYTFNIAVSSTNNITLSSSTDVDVTQADLAGINSAVNSNASSLTSYVSKNVGDMQSQVTVNSTDISTNATNIANLQLSAASNASAISNNATSTSSAISSVSSSNNAVSSSIASTVSTNQSSIATNSSAISNLQSSVASNSADISSNATAISIIGSQATSAINTAMNGLQYRGVWQGGYGSWGGKPDGIYTIDNGQNPIDGFFVDVAKQFTGYGVMTLTTSGSGLDRYCIIQDNINQVFKQHLITSTGVYTGWTRLSDNSNSLQYMGTIPSTHLANITQTGIYNMAGITVDDGPFPVQWGQLIVMNFGGVLNQEIHDNSGTLFTRTINSWGIVGWNTNKH